MILCCLPVFIGFIPGKKNHKLVRLPVAQFFYRNHENLEKPKLSPDGKKLSFIEDSSGTNTICIQDIQAIDNQSVMPTTISTKGTIIDYMWSYDQKYILYVAPSNQSGLTHIFRIELSSQKTVDLTPDNSASSSIIDYKPNHPNIIVAAIKPENSHLSDIYRINIQTGHKELADKNPGYLWQWCIDSNLQVRAAVGALIDMQSEDYGHVDEDRECQLYVRQNETSQWQMLKKWDHGSGHNSAPICFSQDGKHLYILDSLSTDTNILQKIDVQTGAVCQILAHDKQFDMGIVKHIYDAKPVAILNHQRILQAILINKEKPSWTFFDKQIEKDFNAIQKALPNGFIDFIDRDLADTKWVISYSSDIQPELYYVFDRQSKTLSPLFKTLPHDLPFTLAHKEPINFKARDGVMVHGYITYPPFSDKQNLPLVLFVHGGPNERDCWDYDERLQWLANRGYAVLQINYRGSTTYGKKFAQDGTAWKSWANAALNDLIDGTNWALSNNIADPNRIAIMGASQGGYEALCAACFEPHKFACVINISGISNLFITINPDTWAVTLQKGETEQHYLERNKEELRAKSPLFFARQVQCPVFIAHGMQDTCVPCQHAQYMIDELKKHHKSYKAHLFEDEGHSFNSVQNTITLWEAIDEFLAKHMAS